MTDDVYICWRIQPGLERTSGGGGPFRALASLSRPTLSSKRFEMREMRGAGIVTVELVPTELNPADLFTIREAPQDGAQSD